MTAYLLWQPIITNEGGHDIPSQQYFVNVNMNEYKY